MEIITELNLESNVIRLRYAISAVVNEYMDEVRGTLVVAVPHIDGEYSYRSSDIAFTPDSLRSFADQMAALRKEEIDAAVLMNTNKYIEFEIRRTGRELALRIKVRQFVLAAADGPELYATLKTADRELLDIWGQRINEVLNTLKPYF